MAHRLAARCWSANANLEVSVNPRTDVTQSRPVASLKPDVVIMDVGMPIPEWY